MAALSQESFSTDDNSSEGIDSGLAMKAASSGLSASSFLTSASERSLGSPFWGQKTSLYVCLGYLCRSSLEFLPFLSEFSSTLLFFDTSLTCLSSMLK